MNGRNLIKPVLEKPVVGGSKDVWGDILNANIDKVDKFNDELLLEVADINGELTRLETDKATKADLNTTNGEVTKLQNNKVSRSGDTITGMLAIQRNGSGETAIAINSTANGNADIYVGGSHGKGVGFKNRTSGKGIFLKENGDIILEANNLPTTSKDLAGAFTEVISNNQKMMGVSDSVVYIQDVGEKKVGKGYIDKVTKEVYVCMVTNTDTDIKLGKFELATNMENRGRIAKIEEILGIYQPVFNITELSVSRDENVTATTLTYIQK